MLHYSSCLSLFFFFNDTATTEIYTLSLHDALPISSVHSSSKRSVSFEKPVAAGGARLVIARSRACGIRRASQGARDRKSTRLNSSHGYISYAVFCLKKKKNRASNHETQRPAKRRRY